MGRSLRRVGWVLVGHAFIALATAGVAEAQPLSLELHSLSRFWIQGQATTHNFTCRVERVKGRARLPSLSGGPDENEEIQAEVVVRVPVEAFDCGNDRMTSDLQEALKMEEHPEIRFELVHATVGGELDSSRRWRSVEALGTLTIAGKKRLTRPSVAGRALDEEHFRIRGCMPIRMTYYGIEPPTKAFGLIRVKNRVEVQFDLFAHTKGNRSRSLFDTRATGDPPACDGD